MSLSRLGFANYKKQAIVPLWVFVVSGGPAQGGPKEYGFGRWVAYNCS